MKEAQLVFIKENDSNNYVYYVYCEGYKTVVGITKDYKNVYKIKKIYSDILYVDEYNNILKQKDDVYEIKKVVANILIYIEVMIVLTLFFE
ncbi:MAG: hypothetical protein ACI33S_03105 [Bacilli bacterium]